MVSIKQVLEQAKETSESTLQFLDVIKDIKVDGSNEVQEYYLIAIKTGVLSHRLMIKIIDSKLKDL